MYDEIGPASVTAFCLPAWPLEILLPESLENTSKADSGGEVIRTFSSGTVLWVK